MKTIDIIKLIEAEKKAQHKMPTNALESEINKRHSEAKAELKSLELEGKIRIGRTINDRYVIITEL